MEHINVFPLGILKSDKIDLASILKSRLCKYDIDVTLPSSSFVVPKKVIGNNYIQSVDIERVFFVTRQIFGIS